MHSDDPAQPRNPEITDPITSTTVFKKTGASQGTFHARMLHQRTEMVRHLTEAGEIKKRQQNTQKNDTKKFLMMR